MKDQMTVKIDDEVKCIKQYVYTVGHPNSGRNALILEAIYKVYDTSWSMSTFAIVDNFGNKLWFNTENDYFEMKKEIKTPKHYDNSKGTLYKVAQERGWNAYLFDIVKRLERSNKKGCFKEDLEKSIAVIQLWLKESENENNDKENHSRT